MKTKTNDSKERPASLVLLRLRPKPSPKAYKQFVARGGTFHKKGKR